MNYDKEDCGCFIKEMVFTYPEGQSGIKPQIIYCPKHKAAPELYEATKEARDYLRFNKGNASPIFDRLEKAIAKAEGGK